MTPLQQNLLEMLSWFHAFCEKHQLCYYALGGTLLGAVRHKGWIPWDDDIDVGMPLKDYMKFIHITHSVPTQPYFVESPYYPTARFFYPFTKIYDTRTTVIENLRTPFKRGTFLDVFPLSGVGNTLPEALRFLKHTKRKRLFLVARTTGIRKGRKWYKNLSVHLARMIPEFLISNRQLLTSIKEDISRYNFYTSNYIGNLLAEKEIFPAQFFEKPKLYPFENIFIYGPAQPEIYLSTKYGNWQELPPPDKRKTSHDFLYCSLTNSYLENEK